MMLAVSRLALWHQVVLIEVLRHLLYNEQMCMCLYVCVSVSRDLYVFVCMCHMTCMCLCVCVT